MDSLQSLKSRIRGGSSNTEFSEDDLINIHDVMMVEYGWIPLEEFKKLPLPTMWNLAGCISKRKEQERKEYEKSKRKRGKR